MNANGTAHKYGDNVDTDVIIPARYLNTGIQISCGNDDIGIDIIPVFMCCSICIHAYATSFGAAILPIMALAAATAGLARYTSESTCPIRPTKFRFVVATQRSFSASIPI